VKIAESQVKLSGLSYHHFERSRTERLVAWAGDERLEAEREERGELTAATWDFTELSAKARALAAAEALLGGDPSAAATKASPDDSDDELADLDPKYKFKILLIEALTGRKFVWRKATHARAADNPPAGSPNQAPAAQQPERQGWGVRYDSHEETREVERASFTSSGVVKTADGKTITFKANVEMSRERITVKDVHFAAGDALKDPLVINFSGTAAELTDEKTAFDLDADGTAEEISFVKSGSGFLVLDRNGDGAVNDGSELFGPRTGDGFAELAAYDDDQNGWIDESDAVYDRLGVWSKVDGADMLATLRQRNVGAIFLGSAATSFSLRDSQDAAQGRVRSTGAYLTEDGQAGTVQQVDLKT
jgi:hypothetical protein